jgi:hypothetical protein
MTFRDCRYGPLQPTAVAEANSLNDGLGDKSGNPYRFGFGRLGGQSADIGRPVTIQRIYGTAESRRLVCRSKKFKASLTFIDIPLLTLQNCGFEYRECF